MAGVTGIPFIQKILGTGLLGTLVAKLPTKALPATIDEVGKVLSSSPKIASAFVSIIDSADVGKLTGSSPSGEDCLFLDLYVPKKAFAEPNKTLPVINYIYGGKCFS